MTNPNTSPELSLETLAQRLEIASYQTRGDGRGITLIAGAAGHVRPDLYLHLRIPALAAEAKAAARDLIDSGVLAADAGNDLFIRRLPEAGIETRLFRKMLGLFHHLERRAL